MKNKLLFKHFCRPHIVYNKYNYISLDPLKTKFEDLPPKTIDITKLDNVNLAEPARYTLNNIYIYIYKLSNIWNSCVIQNVQFHPEGQILLSSGLDKMLRLYKIGIKSEPICNVFLQDLPIWSSYFLNEGKEVYTLDIIYIYIYRY